MTDHERDMNAARYAAQKGLNFWSEDHRANDEFIRQSRLEKESNQMQDDLHKGTGLFASPTFTSTSEPAYVDTSYVSADRTAGENFGYLISVLGLIFGGFPCLLWGISLMFNNFYRSQAERNETISQFFMLLAVTVFSYWLLHLTNKRVKKRREKRDSNGTKEQPRKVIHPYTPTRRGTAIIILVAGSLIVYYQLATYIPQVNGNMFRGISLVAGLLAALIAFATLAHGYYRQIRYWLYMRSINKTENKK